MAQMVEQLPNNKYKALSSNPNTGGGGRGTYPIKTEILLN
jgi:hypothetical protein